jgi:hypothetical protein
MGFSGNVCLEIKIGQQAGVFNPWRTAKGVCMTQRINKEQRALIPAAGPRRHSGRPARGRFDQLPRLERPAEVTTPAN